MFYHFTLAALALLALAGSSPAQTTWEIDPSHSSAQFSVRHLMVSNVRGEFSGVTGLVQLDSGDITRSRVEATIDARTIHTREPKRDEHLRSAEFLEVSKYPWITFKSRKVARAEDGNLKVTGDLTIRGVTREVVLEVEGPTGEIRDPWGNIKKGASARTKINRKDFGLTWNAALETGGVVVGDQVAVTLDLELVKKAAPAGESEEEKP